MGNLFRKHWTSLLGVAFVLAAVMTLFKYSIDQGWLTNGFKIGVGLLAGAGMIVLGLRFKPLRNVQLLGEIAAGLGVAILYTTCAFAGIYYALWDPMTVFLGMIVITVGTAAYSYRFNSRILMCIGMIGALLSPCVMRPETDQVFSLFLYLLVINATFFLFSLRRPWLELRLVSFLGTWLLYAVYYFHFEPEADVLWSMPFRYATAAFLFYVIAFLATSWRDGQKFDGLNLYLGIVNAVMFGLWAVTLLDGIVHFAYPLFAMGLLYVGAAFAVYRLTGRFAVPVMTKLLGGTFLILLAASQIGSGLEAKPLISVLLWTIVAAIITGIGMYRKLDMFKAAGMIIWIMAGLYWYVVTWYTPRGEWFGTFIPFLNWGAVAWMLVAALGFFISLKVRFAKVHNGTNEAFSTVASILSHLVVGGLLTVQVMNVFLEYREIGESASLALTLSISWGVYALLLFLWGAYSRQAIFRIFGSVVLGIVALKTVFLDLAGKDTMYKVIVLLVLGAISFGITMINNRWLDKNGSQTQPKEGLPQQVSPQWQRTQPQSGFHPQWGQPGQRSSQSVANEVEEQRSASAPTPPIGD